MALRSTSTTPATTAAPFDPDTAHRLAIAASRKVSGNLFSLLLEMSVPEQAADVPPVGDDDDHQGPPWDEDPIEPAPTPNA